MVWVNPHGTARHDVWLKVNLMHGNQMNSRTRQLSVSGPTPRVIAGQLSPDTRTVFKWVWLLA
jgi:hypothetical protein